MTIQQNQEYKDKLTYLEKLREEKKLLESNIADSMRECKEEIEAIKEKYGYYQKAQELCNCRDDIQDASNEIITIKLKCICDAIMDLITNNVFKKCDDIFKWLKGQFGISFCYDFYDYQSLYKDVINNEFSDDDWGYDGEEGGYVICHYWYFRGERDGDATLVIPEKIIDNYNLDDFYDQLNKGIEAIKIQQHKEKVQAEEKAEMERYNLYLKLKKEFGD